MYRVPVILLNYNSSADCAKCVGFLKKQQNVDLEIIIVDNCSRPEDAEKVRQLAQMQGCTFIESDANRGYNAGNNIGLRYAASKGYDYALIANPDMEFPQPDFIATLVRVMVEREDVVVCGGDIVSPEGKHQNPIRESTYSEELLWPLMLVKNRKSDSWYLGDYSRSDYCEKLCGCCILVRMDFIKALGYFDENVFLYSEEAILSKQVKNRNLGMYYCAEAQAVHRHIKSEKGNVNERMSILKEARSYYLNSYSGYSKCQLFALRISRFIEYSFINILR